MIINTNRSEEQQQTIDYIRNITQTIALPEERNEESDSLALSHSESDSLNMHAVSPKKKRKKQKKQESKSKYTSPYKQSSLSMRKITKVNKNLQHPIIPYRDMLIPNCNEKKGTSKSSKKVSSPAKYKSIPPLIEKYQKNGVDQMKAEARQIYEKRERAKGQLTVRQKNLKWADFLLRERRWQSGKQDRKKQASQRAIAKEIQEHKTCFTPREYPRMSIEQHIKLVNRKKTKLKEQLGQQLLNYYTWGSSASPGRQKQRSPLKSESRQVSGRIVKVRQVSPIRIKSANAVPDRKVHLSNNKELQFLIHQNR